jgi:hypothetical protein
VNFTDLTLLFPDAFTPGQIDPLGARLMVSNNAFAKSLQLTDVYTGLSGPTIFGEGFVTGASSGTSAVGVFGDNEWLLVPDGYVSGTPLSAMATWNNTTIAGLGVDVGTFTWTWGTGANADSMTLIVTPEPAPALLLSLGAAGLALLKWRDIHHGDHQQPRVDAALGSGPAGHFRMKC